MKLVLAGSAVCLVAAMTFALAPAEALPPAAVEPIAVAAAAPATPDAPDLVQAAHLDPSELPEPLLTIDDIPLASEEAWLSGRVTPSSGAQPDVQLVFESDDGQVFEADADPTTGEFALQLPPGTWRIVARSDGYLPAYEEGFVVSPGEELADLVMTLERGERITGSVVADEQPVEGVLVSAENGDWVRTALTDGSGRFTLEGLPRGTFTVRAYAAGTGGDEQQAAGGSSVHLALGHRQKIRGRVLDTRGLPVEGAEVFTDYTPIDVVDADPYPSVGVAVGGLGAHGCGPAPLCYHRMTTGADGRFEVDTAPGQTLSIGARRGDAFAHVLDRAAGDDFDLVLEPGVRVQVVDASRTPVAGAELVAAPLPPFFARQLLTDADGWVTLPGRRFAQVAAGPELLVLGDVPVQPWRIKEPLDLEIIY